MPNSTSNIPNFGHRNYNKCIYQKSKKSSSMLSDCATSSLFRSQASLKLPNDNDNANNNYEQKRKEDLKAAIKIRKERSQQRQQQKRRPLGRFIASIYKFIIKSIILNTSFFIMRVINRTHLHDPNNNLQKFLSHRNSISKSNDVGLLTISNHCSILDDPGIWMGILPKRKLILGNAKKIFMTEELYHSLENFKGLESSQLAELHDILNGNGNDDKRKRGWCHIMVEGQILQPWRFQLPTGNTLPQLGKFKLGAAKLIATSPPSKTIILPIYHYGMHKIFPETAPSDLSDVKGTNKEVNSEVRFPRWGNRIDVYIGDPIDCSDLIPKEGFSFQVPNDRNLLDEINQRLRKAMLELESKASRERVIID
jgi:hypothetical protein